MRKSVPSIGTTSRIVSNGTTSRVVGDTLGTTSRIVTRDPEYTTYASPGNVSYVSSGSHYPVASTVNRVPATRTSYVNASPSRVVVDDAPPLVYHEPATRSYVTSSPTRVRQEPSRVVVADTVYHEPTRVVQQSPSRVYTSSVTNRPSEVVVYGSKPNKFREYADTNRNVTTKKSTNCCGCKKGSLLCC